MKLSKTHKHSYSFSEAMSFSETMSGQEGLSEKALSGNSSHANTFNVSLFYCTPSNPIPNFLDESCNFASQHYSSKILRGDFNIPMNHITTHAKTLRSIILSKNLIIHNIKPTHLAGNTLDLIISFSTEIINSHKIGYFSLSTLKYSLLFHARNLHTH